MLSEVPCLLYTIYDVKTRIRNDQNSIGYLFYSETLKQHIHIRVKRIIYYRYILLFYCTYTTTSLVISKQRKERNCGTCLLQNMGINMLLLTQRTLHLYSVGTY